MPNIPSIPIYDPNSVYNHVVDSYPITVANDVITAINNQVDNNTSDISASIGNQGSLANRLNQSLEEDGGLKSEAVDNCLHLISEHTDGNGYVRMELTERAKLSFISEEATAIKIKINTISGIIPFVDETLNIEPSDTIVWQYDASVQKISANVSFPSTSVHRHYYGLVPVTEDYVSFLVTSTATAYIEGSLRVYVNGVRLNQDHEVDVVIDGETVGLFFLEGDATDGVVSGGDFILNEEIAEDTSIVVDFDILLT